MGKNYDRNIIAYSKIIYFPLIEFVSNNRAISWKFYWLIWKLMKQTFRMNERPFNLRVGVSNT